MDLDKILSTLPAIAAEYFHDFIAVVSTPGKRFEPIPTAGDGVVVSSSQTVKLTSDPKLFGFAVISLVVSISIMSLNPAYDLDEAPEMIVNILGALVAWFVYGSIIHLLCKILKGKGSYLGTVSVCVQLFAAISVLGSFVALLFATEFLGILLEMLDSRLLMVSMIADEPFSAFFLFQLAALAIYLPISLKKLHKFGNLQLIVVVAPSICLVVGMAYVLFEDFMIQPMVV